MAPEWKLFDPALDGDAIRGWTPSWADGEIQPPRGRNARGHSSHSLRCPFGDHIPYADPQEDAAEAFGLDMDDLAERQKAGVSHESASAPVVSTAPLPQTALYRWWDAEDVLLYIGISDRLPARVSSHSTASSWMDFAARSAIERHRTREEALAAEEAAIKVERPLFNFQHNSTPEARRRLVEYLISHGRADLLAPVVSRG